MLIADIHTTSVLVADRYSLDLQSVFLVADSPPQRTIVQYPLRYLACYVSVIVGGEAEKSSVLSRRYVTDAEYSGELCQKEAVHIFADGWHHQYPIEATTDLKVQLGEWMESVILPSADRNQNFSSMIILCSYNERNVFNRNICCCVLILCPGIGFNYLVPCTLQLALFCIITV